MSPTLYMRVVRVTRVGSDLSGSPRYWWVTFECVDRRTNDLLNFAAYGADAYRFVNYATPGNYYTIEYRRDEADASDGELVSMSYVP